jgi:hypothetical protein
MRAEIVQPRFKIVPMNLMGIFIPFFCAFVLLIVLAQLVASKADEDRKAVEGEGGRIEFKPNRRGYWGAYIFIGCLGYAVLTGLYGAIHSTINLVPASLCAGFILLILRAYPGSIVADASGIEQLFWLPVHKRIAWNDVATITVNGKNREIGIRGKNGVKILHSRQLPDRERFLEELKKHCPEKLPAELAPTKAMSL